MKRVLAALLVTACGRGQVDVLHSAPDASVTVTDSGPDVGSDADAAEAGGCTARAPTGAACSGAQDCCSGRCDSDPTQHLSCRPATGCTGLDLPCELAAQCCSLACVEGACSPSSCAPAGGACSTNADCCGNSCDAGTCADIGGSCKPAGEACDKNDQCCSGSCQDSHCELLEACRAEGELCVSAAACCSGVCGADGRCALLAQCTSADGKPCSRQVGELCKDDAQCCSRVCQKTGQGVKRCTANGGCRAHCERCGTGADCCSGSCEFGADGVMRCGPPVACLPTGEVCSDAAGCCKEAGKPECVDDPPGIGAKRCRVAGSACADVGIACALGSQCCDGFCLPASEGYACAQRCAADGQPCTTRSDCCGAFSDCLVLSGQRLCAPTIR